MLLDQIPLRFKNLSSQRDVKYFLRDAASEIVIQAVEQRLAVSLPHQVQSFYEVYDGLRVEDPQFEILSLEQVIFSSPNRLRFVTLDQDRELFFDTSKLNQANQWDIVSVDGYRVTLSMASFWSNRMWSWIENRRPIWCEQRAT